MMKRFVIFLALLIVVFAVYVFFADTPGTAAVKTQVAQRVALQAPVVASRVSGSGYIESTDVQIMAEIGGRIAAITADEGDLVTPGMVLVRLDDALLTAQLEQARAGLQMAQATLDKVEVGARPVEIQKAEALVAQAEAAERAAYRAWQDAIVLRDNPQDLDTQIDLARAKVDVSVYQLTSASANTDAAQLSMDALGRTAGLMHDGVDYSKTLPNGKTISGHIDFASGMINDVMDQWNRATTGWWQSWIGVNTASILRASAAQYLQDLREMRNDPQALKAQVDKSAAGYAEAQAQTKAAQASLALIRAGATPEQKLAARAQVDQAKARVAKVETQLGKAVLSSPLAGIVTQRAVEVGEMAIPNATLLTVSQPDEVDLTIYVPEDEVARAEVGASADVIVDSYPNRAFRGQVSFIATDAEFTPKNVQTPEERVNLVFAVKIHIPNPGLELKAGMPADAVLVSDK